MRFPFHSAFFLLALFSHNNNNEKIAGRFISHGIFVEFFFLFFLLLLIHASYLGDNSVLTRPFFLESLRTEVSL